jgi:hypothetical protein
VVRALAKEAGCRMMAISPSDVMDMVVFLLHFFQSANTLKTVCWRGGEASQSGFRTCSPAVTMCDLPRRN